MQELLLLIYVFLGCKAISYIKRNLFGLETVFVFDFKRFILEKMIMGFFLGWIAIPIWLICLMISSARKNNA